MSDDVKYEWDEVKRRANLAKHGVDFADATEFNWSSARIGEDNRHSEQRYTALGFVAARLYVAALTQRNGRIRLISLRKANRREIRSYYGSRKSDGH